MTRFQIVHLLASFVAFVLFVLFVLGAAALLWGMP